jgi:two-component system response regulator HydG
MARILVVEDENILRKNIVDRLRAEGHDLYDAGSAESAVELAVLLAPDLILSDLRLPGMDGLELLRRVRAAAPRTLVVIMTAVGTNQTAMEAIREGAYDYLNKPVELRELVYLVNRAVSHSRAMERVKYANAVERRTGSLDDFVGVSPAIREIKHRVRQLLASPVMSAKDPPVILITGETGTGKSQLAHAIHNECPRRDGPFLSTHCMASSSEEIERVLFGIDNSSEHQQELRKGIVELAEGGTVFLEEITGLSKRVQARLLALLESGQAGVARSDRPRTNIDLQFVVSSSRDLAAELAGGRLIPEFYHRILQTVIHIPPLRDRRDDIAPLAERFLSIHARRSGIDVPRIEAEALDGLSSYDWPGNARELSHAMERAIMVSDHESIKLKHIAESPLRSPAVIRCDLPQSASIIVDFDGDCPSIAEIQRHLIIAAIAYFDGNIGMVAAKLGISEADVRHVVEQHQVAT